MMFSERQYATLDVDLTRVRLHEPLSIIIQQPLLYVRDMVPKPCLDAIIKLDQLTHMKKLRDVARNDLFPTSEMILSLSREFGVPLTTADFEELKEVESETDIDGKHVSVQYAQTSRDWTPIDMYNENYLHYLEERSKYAHKQDYIKQNINNVHEASKTNERVRPKTIAAIPTNGTVHNYSTQYLNSMEQAREKLRQELAKDVHQRFTYCQDYNSSTVVPVNMTQEESVSKDSWRTPDGFIYPGIKNALESNEHIKRPHPAKCDELKEYWRENILHSNILKPTLERDRMTWSERVSDFNLWSKPAGAFDPSVPPTIHHAGDKLAAEQEAAARFELEKWKSKIIVDDTNVHFHRCATDTEQTYRGPKSSNQLDKLQGLLKDEPKKIGLKKSPVLHDIPALSVVLNPSVDTKARHGELPVIDHDNCVNQSHHGYNPGPYQTLSWTLPHNRIPIRDMQHAKFEALKGHDFRLYHKERSVLSRVPIKTLSSEDRNNNLFELGGTEDYRYSSIKSGNICYLQPPPSIKAAPLHTEFYFPDRDKYAEKPTCKKAAAQLAALN
uniref:Uncharacterized protein LOC102807383 n=1 Tax=Saccoglossus kowalevskii TaxID=10224 RepID=A0ABM0MYM3_SACKO|nr:PREDICTED: uncharacterized protein LOC102807383 [Saccoglossus kowalevskii]